MTDIESVIALINELKRNSHTQEYMTTAEVCGRYSVTDMTLWRWSKRPELNFPKPLMIARRRYYRVADLVRWENEQAEGQG